MSSHDSTRQHNPANSVPFAIAVSTGGDHPLVGEYANVCQLTATPEEVILEFGLSAEDTERPPRSRRLVLSFHGAKRLATALESTLRRHEAIFGVLETKVQKRIVPGLRPPADPLSLL